MRGKSLAGRIWATLLAASLVLVISIYGVLNVYYRRELMASMEMRYQYSDAIRYREMENYASTANSCLNTIILQVNMALEKEDLT